MKLEELNYPHPVEPVDAKSFDIEKWRRETPMDYFKAAYILNQANHPIVMAEVFKAIYQVTRYYIPSTLYKYVSLSTNAQSNEKRFRALDESKIFLSAASALNDPYDCKACYYNPEELQKYDRLVSCNGRLIDDFSAFLRVVSLTANGETSMPMWAHYANNHAGYCIAYDMKENALLASCTFPVQYSEQRLDITSLMDSIARSVTGALETQTSDGNNEILIDELSVAYLISLLCNIKQSAWAYENEYRCSMGATTAGMPYVDAKAKAVYIGMNCAPDHVKRLREIGAKLKIPVFYMVEDELSSNYKLIAKAFDE